MTTTEAIGIRLRHYRQLAGMSQVEMGRRLNVTNVHVCNFERGQNGMSIPIFVKACRVLRLKPSAVLSEIGQ